MKLYQKIATCLNAMEHDSSDNEEWYNKHAAAARKLTKEYMPSGSGIDNGTSIDLDRSTGNKLVFNTSFHHMNQDGMYDGWTEHAVIVKPNLQFGIHLIVSGPDRNDIKEYLHEVFYDALMEDYAPGPIVIPVPFVHQE